METVTAEVEGMETEGSSENQPQDAPSADAQAKMDTTEGDAPAEGAEPAKPAQPSPPKQTVKAVELNVESKTASIPQQQLQDLLEREASFQSVDHQERDRIDAKNALEEFVLSIRGRVNDSDDLEPYIESNVRDELVQLADSAENWLYDEGEDCSKNEYVQRLQQVQVDINFFSFWNFVARLQIICFVLEPCRSCPDP